MSIKGYQTNQRVERPAVLFTQHIRNSSRYFTSWFINFFQNDSLCAPSQHNKNTIKSCTRLNRSKTCTVLSRPIQIIFRFYAMSAPVFVHTFASQHHLSAGCCLRNCNYNSSDKLFNEEIMYATNSPRRISSFRLARSLKCFWEC